MQDLTEKLEIPLDLCLETQDNFEKQNFEKIKINELQN